MIFVRYADDLVVGFEFQADAERFLKDFEERLAKFGLEVHPEKTRLIEFGKYARRQRWRGRTRDLYVPRVYASMLRKPDRRLLCAETDHRAEANGGEASGSEAEPPSADARSR